MLKKIFLFYFLFSLILSAKAFALPNSVGRCFAGIKSQSFKSAGKWGGKAVTNHPKSFAARLCLGIADNKLGLYPSAVNNFKAAVSLSKNKIDSMLAYGLLGENLQYTGDTKNALEYDLKSLKLATGLKNRSFESSGYNNIADIYKNEGKFKKALLYFDKSLKFSSNKISKATTYGNIGLVYDKTGNYGKALYYQTKALKLNESIGSNYGSAEDLLNMGGTYLYLKKFGKAKHYILKGLSLEKTIGNKKWIGSGYGYLANLNFLEGNDDKAVSYYKKAYLMYKSSGDSPGAKTCLFMINKIKSQPGNTLVAKCAYDLNKHNYKLSLSVCGKAADNYPKSFYPLFLDGKANMVSKNYNLALTQFKKAAPYAKSIGDKQLLYNWTGGCYADMKNYKMALLDLKESLSYAKEINNAQDEINNLALIKNIYFVEKNYKKDIYYSKEFASLLKSKEAIALEYDEIGVSYYDLGNYQASIRYDKKSFAINKGIKNYAAASLNMLNIGHAYIGLKKYGMAKKTLIQGISMAKESRDVSKTAWGYLNMGYLYENLNKNNKSIAYYSKAYSLYKTIKDKVGEKFCLLTIAKLRNKSK